MGIELFSVIPAKAGIQRFQGVAKTLDPGFPYRMLRYHRGDEQNSIFSQLPSSGVLIVMPDLILTGPRRLKPTRTVCFLTGCCAIAIRRIAKHPVRNDSKRDKPRGMYPK